MLFQAAIFEKVFVGSDSTTVVVYKGKKHDIQTLDKLQKFTSTPVKNFTKKGNPSTGEDFIMDV